MKTRIKLLAAGLGSALALGGGALTLGPTTAGAQQAPPRDQTETIGANQPAEAPGAPEAAEANEGPDTDGPGGHEDLAGQPPEHQFDGNE